MNIWNKTTDAELHGELFTRNISLSSVKKWEKYWVINWNWTPPIRLVIYCRNFKSEFAIEFGDRILLGNDSSKVSESWCWISIECGSNPSSDSRWPTLMHHLHQKELPNKRGNLKSSCAKVPTRLNLPGSQDYSFYVIVFSCCHRSW